MTKAIEIRELEVQTTEAKVVHTREANWGMVKCILEDAEISLDTCNVILHILLEKHPEWLCDWVNDNLEDAEAE